MLLQAEREGAELLAKIEKAKIDGDSAEGSSAPMRATVDFSPPAPCRQWLALSRESRLVEDPVNKLGADLTRSG